MEAKKIYLASKAPCVNGVFAAFTDKKDAIEHINYQQKAKPSVDLYLSNVDFNLLDFGKSEV